MSSNSLFWPYWYVHRYNPYNQSYTSKRQRLMKSKPSFKYQSGGTRPLLPLSQETGQSWLPFAIHSTFWLWWWNRGHQFSFFFCSCRPLQSQGALFCCDNWCCKSEQLHPSCRQSIHNQGRFCCPAALKVHAGQKQWNEQLKRRCGHIRLNFIGD